MDYTLNQLRIFKKVVEFASITKASRALDLTQPAVSIQLRNLQRQFKFPLYETINKKIYITDYGYEIAQNADIILAEAELLQYKMRSNSNELFGNIKFSIVSTAKYVLPYFIKDFSHLHKAVDFTIDVTNKAGVIESLERNETDFALVSLLPEHINTEHIALLKNELYYVSNQRNINELDINSQPLIYRESGSATRQLMEDYIRREALAVKKQITLVSNEAVKQSVIAGLGNSILPLIGLKNELKSQELFIKPMPLLPIVTNWNLVWLKGKRLQPAAAALLDYLKENKQEIVVENFDWIEEVKASI